MSARSSLTVLDELKAEERKSVIAARNHLSKTDEDWNDIIEGFQLFDVRLFSFMLNSPFARI